MVLNQYLSLKKTPPAWIWVLIFLLSISGTFYLGLNPDFIAHWWGYLVGFNIIMSLVAVYYVYVDVLRLKRDVKGDVVGSKFTWSFVKIVPVLVIVPVLSFYMFSFQTIQNNVKDSEKAFNVFSQNFIQQVNGLYSGVQKIRDERYTEQTKRLLTLITSFGSFQKDVKNYAQSMQIFLDGLIDKGWACQITLLNAQEEMVAKTANVTNCMAIKEQPLLGAQPRMINEDETANVIQVKMSTRYLFNVSSQDIFVIDVVYATDPGLLGFLSQVRGFASAAQNIKFEINTSITQKRFMIDFSSTILLAILSAIMVVFRMIERLMKPLNNLSIAAQEIAKGNYDVRIVKQEESEDVRSLLEQFNTMSRQIKASREDLDTHNLYLETILKYSYGVIALDQNRKIRLINPVVGAMLGIKDEKLFIGKKCNIIVECCSNLKPLFSMTQDKFKQGESEWSEEIEITLVDRHLLLSCQGAALKNNNETLGFVIIIKDISKLNRAQKKAAWGEVAKRMAHEIKNPLTPILLSAQRLRNRFLMSLEGKDLDVINKTTNTIIHQVQSMDVMLSAFADYANTPQVERMPCNLNALINQSISLYDDISKMNIDLDLNNNIPLLFLDSNSISRVLINLVKNASEAMIDGRDLNVKIITEYLPKQAIVRLSIIDNGDGFDKHVLDRVFEPYVTTKAQGGGLGMTIVQNIIKQHKAKIFASNINPNGAMITIEFDCKG
ncbi:sensor histidine kinase [Candidatus Vesicomyidisocius sp. SY067_SCS001]|uniref:sensor histidine kinase n=1 Tax=Candidatus Vesicomyidisocius sp. SY067_SCS001 TaxID=2732590 RepID=UPI001688439E|nr:ATP-binding protein [Candidatus Vesicomyosocius sp. SY067_SCS001]